jgi:hypothetical protein
MMMPAIVVVDAKRYSPTWKSRIEINFICCLVVFVISKEMDSFTMDGRSKIKGKKKEKRRKKVIPNGDAII